MGEGSHEAEEISSKGRGEVTYRGRRRGPPKRPGSELRPGAVGGEDHRRASGAPGGEWPLVVLGMPVPPVGRSLDTQGLGQKPPCPEPGLPCSTSGAQGGQGVARGLGQVTGASPCTPPWPSHSLPTSTGPAFTMAGGRPQPKRSFSIIPCFVFVESVLLGIVVLLAYRLEFTDTFPVHTQGFFCYDSTYAKPYPGPEAASRVPPALIYALVTAGPTLTILLGELARAFFPGPPSTIPIIGESTIVSGACCRFSPPLRRLVRFLGVYSFGLFTTTIFANAGQVVTGNPTPHFLSVCRPNYTALGCPPPSPDRPGPDRFVTDQGACAGSPSLVAAARRAFPCKDAALCAYAVTYTAMYVTLVFRVKGSRLVKPSLCLALLCPAFLVGVVRVAEYRNHWSDVLAGFLTGAAIATFLVTCVVHNFQSRRPSGRRFSPWEDLGQAPTMDSPLEKLSVAQVRGAGVCSRLERVVGGGGPRRQEFRQELGVSGPPGGRGITHLCGPGSWGTVTQNRRMCHG
uniref:Phospholipid phosphatase-related protein type 2 n=1 Tax=Suricata suricatta TaxID=37032 RepID=A0A673VJ27_SURSU